MAPSACSRRAASSTACWSGSGCVAPIDRPLGPPPGLWQMGPAGGAGRPRRADAPRAFADATSQGDLTKSPEPLGTLFVQRVAKVGRWRVRRVRAAGGSAAVGGTASQHAIAHQGDTPGHAGAQRPTGDARPGGPRAHQPGGHRATHRPDPDDGVRCRQPAGGGRAGPGDRPRAVERWQGTHPAADPARRPAAHRGACGGGPGPGRHRQPRG